MFIALVFFGLRLEQPSGATKCIFQGAVHMHISILLGVKQSEKGRQVEAKFCLQA